VAPARGLGGGNQARTLLKRRPSAAVWRFGHRFQGTIAGRSDFFQGVLAGAGEIERPQMSKALSIGLLAILLATGAVADPATPAVQPTEATGIIVSIDAGALSVTLADGQTYLLPATITPSTFGVGAMVIIDFTADPNGVRKATAVTTVGDPMPTPAKSGAG
jgi:hypothetical protein